ncbi:hypothetical protein ACFV6U_37765 [Streptomyces sp. NPDC059810]|uniref:hypothetical protein n=1 Tax=Streptomyces sp. NPDC059810 TaxID=3346956 RepID=UPI003666A244
MDDENVITFRPREGAAPPGLPPLPPMPASPPPPPTTATPAPPTASPTVPPPAPAPEAGAVSVPERPRTSAVASLTAATAGPPPLPPVPPATTAADAPTAADIPATFRSEGIDPRPAGGPTLGALSLSAVLAVALAALRGTVSFVQDWRQRRTDRAAEEAEWREAKVKRLAAEEDARARVAKVPSSAEYGRKAVLDGRKAASGPQRPASSGTGGRGPLGAPVAPVKKTAPAPAPVPVPKPVPKGPVDPGKPRGPEPKGKTPDRPKGPDGKAPDGGKPKPLDKPPRPSSGVLAPGKGKSSGAPAKGLLERVRDRKSPDTRKASDTVKSPDTRKGGGIRKGPGGGKSDPATKPAASTKPGKPDPKAGGGTATAKPTKPAGRPERGKKVPGIKHGTADGYDVHGCRCRRCRKVAHGKTPKPPKAGTGSAPSGSTGPGGSSRPSGKRGGWRMRSARKGRKGGTGTTGATSLGGASRPSGKRGAWRMRGRKGRMGGTGTTGATSPGGAWAPPPPAYPPHGAWVPPPPPPYPPRGARRSADEDLHTATAWTETVITVERADRPGDARRARPAAAAVTAEARSLPRAPHVPAGPRPGTTAPKETTPVAASSIRLSAPAGVAAEHLTDVTLDDVLDHLVESKRKCFATYDECAVLADGARKLRRSLEQLADELTEHHNLVGRLTGAAMSRLAEAMDVVARKAEQMRTESLAAAERVELAHDAMHDAYRPVQDATAAAGLVMPSARIHNDD